jgi:MFS family permease
LVGIVVTAHSVGFLVGCLFAASLIRAVGHIRAFAASAAAVSAASLAFVIGIEPVFWTVLRLVTGFCSAALFTVCESWISGQTPPGLRGRVLGLYMISNKVAVGGGQLALAAGGGLGIAFFLLSSAAYSLSLIPVALTRGATPKPPELVTFGLRKLYRIAPVGVVGCFTTGLVNGAVTGVLPVYGLGLGLGTEVIAVLLALMQLGSFLLQWPLGWISDRRDRRLVIAGAALAVVVLSVAIALAGSRSVWLLYLLFLLWGGFALSVYALCLAHAGDFAEPGEMVPLASSLLLAWAAGSVIGPTLATLVMEGVGPTGLFVYAATVSVLLAMFVAWRMTRRRPKPPEERDRFVYVQQTSPAAAELDPRTPAGNVPDAKG